MIMAKYYYTVLFLKLIDSKCYWSFNKEEKMIYDIQMK